MFLINMILLIINLLNIYLFKMSDNQIEIRITHADKYDELRRALNDGRITTYSSVNSSTLVSDRHNEVLASWVEQYASGSDRMSKNAKSQINQLKLTSASGNARNFSYGIIPCEDNEQVGSVTAFVVWFTEQDNNGNRTYHNNSVDVELNANNFRDFNYISNYSLELAALVLEGRVANLKITKEQRYIEQGDQECEEE